MAQDVWHREDAVQCSGRTHTSTRSRFLENTHGVFPRFSGEEPRFKALKTDIPMSAGTCLDEIGVLCKDERCFRDESGFMVHGSGVWNLHCASVGPSYRRALGPA